MRSQLIRGNRVRMIAVPFFMLIAVSPVDAAPLYTLTDFGSAIPVGIDDAGDVLFNNGYDGVYHSYGPNAGLVTPPSGYGLSGSNAGITAIVNSGTVVGEAVVGNSDQAFISSGGQVTDLGVLSGYAGTGAVAANASGVVVGDAYPSSGVVGGAGFIYANGQMINIGTLGGSYSDVSAVNASGQVTGSSTTSAGQANAYLYQNGTMTNLGTLGGTQSVGFAINAQGQIVGSSTLAAASSGNVILDAFLYSHGQMLALPNLPGSTLNEAFGINNSSQIVGDSGNQAVLWQNGNIYNLNALLNSPAPFTLTYAAGINNLGQIIGMSYTGGTWEGFLLTPDSLPPPAYIPPFVDNVPEPGSLAVFCVISCACLLSAHSLRNRTVRTD